MKSYLKLWEELATTADAGFGTGDEIKDDDMRTLSKPLSTDSRDYQKVQGGIGADEGGEN